MGEFLIHTDTGLELVLEHHGILGQKWGVRRFQNPDGTLTAEGKARYQNLHGAELEESLRRDAAYKLKKNKNRFLMSNHTGRKSNDAAIKARDYFSKEHAKGNKAVREYDQGFLEELHKAGLFLNKKDLNDIDVEDYTPPMAARTFEFDDKDLLEYARSHDPSFKIAEKYYKEHGDRPEEGFKSKEAADQVRREMTKMRAEGVLEDLGFTKKELKPIVDDLISYLESINYDVDPRHIQSGSGAYVLD